MSLDLRNDQFRDSVAAPVPPVIVGVAGANPFWRLVWMEYRVQRAFWFIALSLVAGVQLTLLAVRPELSEMLGVLSLSLPLWVGVVYAIGCAAMSFAEVHENGTARSMRERGLPAKTWTTAKLTWGLLSVSVIVLSGVALAWISAEQESLGISRWGLALSSEMASVAAFLVSTIAAMIARRVLQSLLLGGIGTVVVLAPLMQFSEGDDEPVVVLAAGLGLVCLVYFLAERWLHADSLRELLSYGRSMNADGAMVWDSRRGASSHNGLRSAHASVMRVAGTLLVGGLFAKLAMLVLASVWRWDDTSEWRPFVFRCLDWGLGLLTILLGWLLGDLSVRAEQRRLAAGDPPASWSGWLARQTVLIWLAAWWFAGSVGDSTIADKRGFALGDRVSHDQAMCWSLLAFGVSQLSAIIHPCRRWAIPASVLTGAWMAACWWLADVLDLFPRWTVTASVVGLMVAAGVCGSIPQFRSTALRRWLTWSLLSVIPCGSFLIGTSVLRLSEVPPVPASVLAHRHDLPPDNDAGNERLLWERVSNLTPLAPDFTDDQYQRGVLACFHRERDWLVMDGYIGWDQVSTETKAWVETVKPVVDQQLAYLRTGRLDEVPVVKYEVAESSHQGPAIRTEVAWALLARRAEGESRLDDAWQLYLAGFRPSEIAAQTARPQGYYLACSAGYLHYEKILPWVRHRAQTSAILRRAINDLREARRFPGPSRSVAVRFGELTQRFDSHAVTHRTNSGERSWSKWGFAHLCFGEPARERRLLQWLDWGLRKASEDLEQITLDWGRRVTNSMVTERTLAYRPPSNLSLPNQTEFPISGEIRETVAASPRLVEIDWSSHSYNALASNDLPSNDEKNLHWNSFIGVEAQRRYLVMELAIRAFELDHDGESPTRMEQLVPEYLATAPVDVWTGRALLPVPKPPPQVQSPIEMTEPSPPAVMPITGEPLTQPVDTPTYTREWLGSRWNGAIPFRGKVVVEINFRDAPRLAIEQPNTANPGMP